MPLPTQSLAGLTEAEVDAMPRVHDILDASDLEDQIEAEGWSGVVEGPTGSYYVYSRGMRIPGWHITLAEAELAWRRWEDGK